MVALANEREANIAEAVRSMIADSVQSQLEAYRRLERTQSDCERARIQLEEAQRTIKLLETTLVKLQLENSLLKDGYDQIGQLCNPCTVGDPSRLSHSRPSAAPLRPLPSTAGSQELVPSTPSATPTPTPVPARYSNPWLHEQPCRSSACHIPAPTVFHAHSGRFA